MAYVTLVPLLVLTALHALLRSTASARTTQANIRRSVSERQCHHAKITHRTLLMLLLLYNAPATNLALPLQGFTSHRTLLPLQTTLPREY
eukprot:3022348-Pleurochrysis_carterae.AAC.1